jgi:hypothetical protein
MFATLAWWGMGDATVLGARAHHRDGRTLRGSVPAFPDYLDPQLAYSHDG